VDPRKLAFLIHLSGDLYNSYRALLFYGYFTISRIWLQNENSGYFLGAFGDFEPDRIVQLLLSPQMYPLPSETHVLRYRALELVQRSHL